MARRKIQLDEARHHNKKNTSVMSIKACTVGVFYLHTEMFRHLFTTFQDALLFLYVEAMTALGLK